MELSCYAKIKFVISTISQKGISTCRYRDMGNRISLFFPDKSHIVSFKKVLVCIPMSSFRIRPRFKHFIKTDKDEIESTITNALTSQKQFVFSYLPGHICIKVHPSERHSWSPQLDLSFEQEGETVIVRGLYGPNPTLWVIFFFGYAIISILSLFAMVWGFSVWTLGGSPSILWAIPALAAAALILYLISQTGQKLGAQQMFDIHHFYEGITKDRIIVH